jgi:hypothetical protein
LTAPDTKKVAALGAATFMRGNYLAESTHQCRFSFLRRTSIPVSARPRRATAEPPSGTGAPFAEKENVVLVVPPALWVVKLQSMAVLSNPLPLTIPLLSIERFFD